LRHRSCPAKYYHVFTCRFSDLVQCGLTSLTCSTPFSSMWGNRWYLSRGCTTVRIRNCSSTENAVINDWEIHISCAVGASRKGKFLLSLGQVVKAFAGDGAAAIYRPENMTSGDPQSGCPRVNRYLHPCRHRRGPNAPVLPDEIHNAPASVTLLDNGRT
jgi:hypothetical protein